MSKALKTQRRAARRSNTSRKSAQPKNTQQGGDLQSVKRAEEQVYNNDTRAEHAINQPGQDSNLHRSCFPAPANKNNSTPSSSFFFFFLGFLCFVMRKLQPKQLVSKSFCILYNSPHPFPSLPTELNNYHSFIHSSGKVPPVCPAHWLDPENWVELRQEHFPCHFLGVVFFVTGRGLDDGQLSPPGHGACTT